MKGNVFSSCVIKNELSAQEFFKDHCSDIRVMGGARGRFEYATRACRIGTTVVGDSVTMTGWAYEKEMETDGFLLTVPELGVVTWRTSQHHYESKTGAVFIADQREIIRSGYSANCCYKSIFLTHEDVINYLRSLSDEPPKARVSFASQSANALVGQFLASFSQTVLALSSNALTTNGGLLDQLKESLICFTLYNINNNYSQSIRSASSMLTPTPNCIKITAAYINQNFSQSLTISSLAAHANVSIRGLQAGFKKYKNTTPMGYLREVRLTNARKIIADKNIFLTLKQVSSNCGFTNYYLFSKYYTARFAESPFDSMRAARKHIL